MAALGIAMVLLPLGAFVVFQCRTDMMIEHNLRAEIEAFYVAEAGLEHAVAEIRPGQSFDQILLGPDQVAGTADDGMFPFVEGAPSAFPDAPFRYAVRVTQDRDGTLHVISQGSGVNGASRVTEALVTRSHTPFTPAALYAEGDVAGLDLGSAGFLVSGFDRRTSAAPAGASGSAPPVSALATSGADAESILRRRLASDSDRLLGVGGSPSVTTTQPLGLESYAKNFASAPECVTYPATTAEEDTFGTVDAPQPAVVAGDLTVPGHLTGSGVLVIQGTLYVDGTFNFTGLVLAMGGLVFESSSTVTISGALWRAANPDARLQLRGRGAITYSSAALAAADQALPGRLPHATVVAAWQEQL